MKILYASCRYDPLDRDAGSGVDFNIHSALLKTGAQVRIAGPYKDVASPIENLYRKVHRVFSGKLHAKFSTAYLKSCACIVEAIIQDFKPDVLFTHNLIPLVYLETDVPIVYKSDAVLWNMHAQWPTYSKLELARMLGWERTAVHKAARIITASHWAQTALVEHYGIPLDRILVLPIPSSLPVEVVPQTVNHLVISKDEVHLLAVAKDYHLKGIDIAIETTRLLREMGFNARLRVAGQSGENSEHIEYMGLFQKKDLGQMQSYLRQYEWAHFLIHPARYEAAGIVCGEAAAFGVPTITNGIGGLATTVEDGVSGVVLPMLSPAGEYVRAIAHYIKNPDVYTNLRKKTRKRYVEELNWDTGGEKIMQVIQRVVDEKKGERIK